MKAYESAKTEDMFIEKFNVPFWTFLEIEKRFKLDEEQILSQFEKELQKKLNKKGRFYLGATTMIQMEKLLKEGRQIGPITYQKHP